MNVTPIGLERLSLATHAREALGNYAKQLMGKPAYGEALLACTTVAHLIDMAQKFRLPDGGTITGVASTGEGAQKTFNEFGIRLPYQIVALEYSDLSEVVGAGQIACPDRVVVAWHPDEKAEEIYICPLWRGRDLGWGQPLGIVSTRDGNEWHFRYKMDAGGVLSPPGTVMDDQSLLDDFTQEVMAVAELIAALSCKNVYAKDNVPPPALNARRIKRGKVPFYSFKTLEIDSGASVIGPALGGTHASPRVHLRRGHIRRLSTGNIWVNACVVGDKKKGMVTKDYSVREAAA
jgi:hypothetical protein